MIEKANGFGDHPETCPYCGGSWSGDKHSVKYRANPPSLIFECHVKGVITERPAKEEPS